MWFTCTIFSYAFTDNEASSNGQTSAAVASSSSSLGAITQSSGKVWFSYVNGYICSNINNNTVLKHIIAFIQILL